MTARIVLWVGREEEEMRIGRLARILGFIEKNQPKLLRYILVMHDWKGELNVLINAKILVYSGAQEKLENNLKRAWEAENECVIKFEYVNSKEVD